MAEFLIQAKNQRLTPPAITLPEALLPAAVAAEPVVAETYDSAEAK
jgi:hypothetical protein